MSQNISVIWQRWADPPSSTSASALCGSSTTIAVTSCRSRAVAGPARHPRIRDEVGDAVRERVAGECTAGLLRLAAHVDPPVLVAQPPPESSGSACGPASTTTRRLASGRTGSVR